MEHKEMKSKVGKSATKIWDAYQDLLGEMKTQQNGGITSTVAVAQQQKTEAAVTTAQSVDVNSIDSVVNGLLKNVESAKSTFEDLQVAINTKKSELNEVHGIEVEANTLVAIVATKDKLVAEKEEQARQILEEAQLKADDLRHSARVDAQRVKEETELQRRDDETTRLREKEQYEYSFAREKRTKIDEVQDEINKKVKVLVERTVEIEAREEASDTQDARILDLQSQIEGLEENQETLVQAAIEKAKASAATSANIAKAMDKKGYEADMSIMTAEVKTLKDQLADHRARLESAQNQVQAANERSTALAQSALQAGADAATVSEVSKIAAGSGKK